MPMLFIICTAVIWGFAFYFFLAKLTSWQVKTLLAGVKCAVISTILNFETNLDRDTNASVTYERPSSPLPIEYENRF